MFFGGTIRKIDGILAVHQAGSYGQEYDSSKERVSKTQQNTQYAVSEIIGILNEFNTPPFVYEKMLGSRKFYLFSATEKTRLELKANATSSELIDEINEFIKKFLQHLNYLKLSKEDKASTEKVKRDT